MNHDPIDSYPLSPMQLGMVADQPLNENTGLDIIQFDCVFESELDPDAFRAAWEWAVARHDALRTCFRWTEGGRVAQDLYRQVELPWTTVGHGRLTADEWENFVRSDRVKGFRLDQPPLERCTLAPGDGVTHFAFTFHHSILDGRSMMVLWREVFARYDELRGMAAAQFPEPPRYRSFIDWLQARDRSGDESFWRGLLGDFRTPTLLGGGGVAGLAVDHEELDIQLSAELSETLRALAKRYDLTLNTVIQGAWAILLSRYTDQDDVVFGAVRSVRRGVPDGENLVGMLLNTLPVRARTWDDQPLPEFLATLRAQAIAVRDHQHTPLMDWRRWADVPPGERLFDSLVVYENSSMPDALRAQGGGWARRSFRIRRQPAYPLVLQVFAEKAVLMKLVYDRTRYAPETIATMGGHLRHVFERIAADPQTRTGAVHVLAPAETRRALAAWNPTATGHEPPGCLHDRVARRAAAGDGALALVSGDRRLSYGELDRWANRIGHTLMASGVGRDQVVAVLAEASPELVAGELGILRAGAACLPVAPGTPPERLAALLDTVGVDVVLAGSEQASRLPSRVRLLDLGGGFDEAPSHDPMCGAVPEDLAFVFDRSGPDAEPVPLAIPHAAVVNLADSVAGVHRLTASDRVALMATCSYEASMLEIWPALAAGASLHAPGPVPDADGWLAEHGITVAFLPAASAGATIARLAARPGKIRAVIVVGRVFNGQVQEGPFEIRYLTGPEEGGVVSIQGGAAPARPTANTEAYVLDGGGRPVPPAVAGELCIAGACLARGIAGRPAMTAERFRPHPFSATPGARIYHSGVAARRAPDGRLELLGQYGAPVIVGARPDPARIETALRRHPSIADAAVLVTETDRGTPQVMVFAMPGHGGQVPADEVHQTVADLLPHQAVPVRVQTVPELPATGSGRLDARALLDRAEAEAGAATTPEPAEHAHGKPLAERVASVWADVLGCGEGGRKALLAGATDFFQLGGHSMFAIAAALRLSAELDVSIPGRLVFDAPTVAAFTDRLEKLLDAGSSLRTTKIVPMLRD